mgnify:CR=1 FL=1|jgi:site-specific recombinase
MSVPGVLPWTRKWAEVVELLRSGADDIDVCPNHGTDPSNSLITAQSGGNINRSSFSLENASLEAPMRKTERRLLITNSLLVALSRYTMPWAAREKNERGYYDLL